MEDISYWSIFINCLNGNQGLIIFVEMVVTAGIFIGILLITRRYAQSTKEIAEKTSESVKATREQIKVVNDIEKAKLTYKLIEEWVYDKKLLSFKREKVGDQFLKSDSSKFDFQKGAEFIEHFNNLLDYFTFVDELMKYSRIESKLFLKVLCREIVNFYENEFDMNNKIVSGIRDRFRVERSSLPVTSDFSALRKIYEIARNDLNK